ncbi:MAG: hypothetical protein PWQ67_1430 [Clostridia bacterium]|jgi:hypothetical protein|nr:hypothetical protein [Clostridia bacterium]MDN5322976.1 hypothetical protein [Clostridia bacterium]
MGLPSIISILQGITVIILGMIFNGGVFLMENYNQIIQNLQDMKTIINSLRQSALNNATMTSQLSGMEFSNQITLNNDGGTYKEMAEMEGITATKLKQISNAESAAVQQLDRLAQKINSLEMLLR